MDSEDVEKALIDCDGEKEREGEEVDEKIDEVEREDDLMEKAKEERGER
jgi:hypothetical protein